MFQRAKRTKWYTEGGMVGYTYAKQNLDVLNNILKDRKLNSTKIQKFIIKGTINFSNDDWHYFNNFSTKDIAHLKHALKKVNKSNVVNELHWIEARTGMLRTPLTKTMHVLAYKLQPKKYLEYASKDYKFYGMNDKQAKERAISLLKKWEKDLGRY